MPPGVLLLNGKQPAIRERVQVFNTRDIEEILGDRKPFESFRNNPMKTPRHSPVFAASVVALMKSLVVWFHTLNRLIAGQQIVSCEWADRNRKHHSAQKPAMFNDRVILQTLFAIAKWLQRAECEAWQPRKIPLP